MAEGDGEGAREIVLRAAGKDGAQLVRANPAKSITPKVRARFLDALSTSSSVRLAAEGCAFTPSAFYNLRRRDGEFAREWDQARADGIARLEFELIRRAEAALAKAPGDTECTTPSDGDGPTAGQAMTVDQAIAVVRLFNGRDARPDGARARRHWNWTAPDPVRAGERILDMVAKVRRARGGAGDASGGQGNAGQGNGVPADAAVPA